MRDLLDQGITVGLGTDVSGGYSASILVVAREAGMVSRTLASLTPEEPHNEEKERAVVNENENENEKDEPNTKDAVTDTKTPTTNQDSKKLSVEECLYLATRGGAACLGLERKVGAFEVGMEFDAQLIELGSAAAAAAVAGSEDGGEGEGEGGSIDRDMDSGLVELWGKETWNEKVAKWLFCGDDRNTRKVFVRGRLVHERR